MMGRVPKRRISELADAEEEVSRRSGQLERVKAHGTQEIDTASERRGDLGARVTKHPCFPVTANGGSCTSTTASLDAERLGFHVHPL